MNEKPFAEDLTELLKLLAAAVVHWEQVRNQVDPGQCDIGYTLDPVCEKFHEMIGSKKKDVDSK